METLVLTLDTIAIMAICYFSYRSEKSPGQAELGPFRIRTAKESAKPVPPTGTGRRMTTERPVRRR